MALLAGGLRIFLRMNKESILRKESGLYYSEDSGKIRGILSRFWMGVDKMLSIDTIFDRQGLLFLL